MCETFSSRKSIEGVSSPSFSSEHTLVCRLTFDVFHQNNRWLGNSLHCVEAKRKYQMTRQRRRSHQNALAAGPYFVYNFAVAENDEEQDAMFGQTNYIHLE